MDKLGEILHKIGGSVRNSVLLTADNANLFKTKTFERDFEERIFNYGRAPQNALGAAAAFASAGKQPIVLLLGKDIPLVYEQIRNLISLPNLNVKIISLNTGLSAVESPSALPVFDDLSLFRNLPNFKIYCPYNFSDLASIFEQTTDEYGPVYIRLPWSRVLELEEKFEIPEYGDDVVFFSHGATTFFCAGAIKILRELGIKAKLLDCTNFMPLDRDLVLPVLKMAKVVVAVEDHYVHGGLATSLADLVCEDYPRDIYRMGLCENFDELADAQTLYKKHFLTSEKIAERVFNWWRELGYH